jgi:hypothetical protein
MIGFFHVVLQWWVYYLTVNLWYRDLSHWTTNPVHNTKSERVFIWSLALKSRAVSVFWYHTY